MINITPIAVPFGMGTATKLQVQVNPHLTDATTCQLYYSLLNGENAIVHQGTYTLTEAEFAAWGADNSFLDDLVLNTLNITRDENN